MRPIGRRFELSLVVPQAPMLQMRHNGQISRLVQLRSTRTHDLDGPETERVTGFPTNKGTQTVLAIYFMPEQSCSSKSLTTLL